MQNPLFDKPPELPDFETALRELERLPLHLYQAFEYGASKTAEYRQAEYPNGRLDECLSACIFRFHALLFLKNQGIEALPDADFSIEQLPFLGISFHYNDYHIRVLKGQDGELPGCGPSDRKTRFFNQIQTPFLLDRKPMFPKANLIVTWAFEANYNLQRLWLVLPARGGPTVKDVSAYWCGPIPHPAEGLSGVPTPPTPPADDLDGLVAPLDEGAVKPDKSGTHER
jgi:hypothetical protein